MIESFTNYANFISNNSDIWQSGVFLGITVVGVSCLAGFMIYATVAIFKMIAGR